MIESENGGQAAERDFGFAADEVVTGEATSAARLRWAIVVQDALPAGRAVNAAACVAAATAVRVTNLLGPGGEDAGGAFHAGLPWAGCTVYTAGGQKLTQLRGRAARMEGVLVVDMPAGAQATRVYDEYLADLAGTEPDEIEYAAVSVVGPRKQVGKLVGSLSLL